METKVSQDKKDSPKNAREQAVFAAAGKQYLVEVGDVITIDAAISPKDDGQKIDFDQVLMTAVGSSVKLGDPMVKGAVVMANVIDSGKGAKLRVAKFRSKAGPKNQTTYGHRQHFTKVKITAIKA